MKKILYGFIDDEILTMDFSGLKQEILSRSGRKPEDIAGDLLRGKRDDKNEKVRLCYSRMLAAILDMDDVLLHQ